MENAQGTFIFFSNVYVDGKVFSGVQSNEKWKWSGWKNEYHLEKIRIFNNVVEKFFNEIRNAFDVYFLTCKKERFYSFILGGIETFVTEFHSALESQSEL